MTVEQLRKLLDKYPPSMLVCYGLYSEQCLLEEEDITVETFCLPRADGWVHDYREDKPSQEYLRFPGN